MSQISVSPSGLVWAVTWNGKALVRLGVSRINPTGKWNISLTQPEHSRLENHVIGTVWSEVDSPDPSSHLSHICVGESAVWALSRDRQVWFRNGVRASSAKDSESLAKGSKWIEMVGELQMLSLGPGDQVLGITDDEDHHIVFRTGVNPSDLSGKTWKAISAAQIRPRSQSQSSTASSNSSAAVYSDNFAKIPEESPEIRPNVASGKKPTKNTALQ